MSRVIKFRAWFPAECFQDGKPRMFNHIAISPDGKVMHLEGGWDYMGDDDKAIPLQFTGRIDREGKEIYDGDIVSDGYHEKYGRYVVAWDNKSCGWNFVSVDGAELKVIGNIYESPELLEPNKG